MALIGFAIIAWCHHRQPAYWLLGSYLGLLLIGLNLYGNFFSSDLFDHYLATLFPVFFLILAVILDRFFLPWGIIGLISIIGLNLSLFSRTTTQDSYSLKRQTVAWAIEQVGDQPFRLDSLSSCFRYNGTRYLFTLAGKEPAQSFVDSNFSWLYRQPQTDLQPQLLLFFARQGFPVSLLTNKVSRRSFGAWEVLILANEI